MILSEKSLQLEMRLVVRGWGGCVRVGVFPCNRALGNDPRYRVARGRKVPKVMYLRG